MDEYYYENLFNIKTEGQQKIFNESLHYNRYEPTSYSVLQTLFKNYELDSNDVIVDFGCGKGRLNFYINYFFNAKVTGVEMNKFYYQESVDNKKSYLKKHKKDDKAINFLNCFAQDYQIQEQDNKFYFFNPFSLQIFIKVIDNILLSIEKFERTVDLILYYPIEDYIYYLENITCFELLTEIKLTSSYDKNNQQLIVIYRLSY